MLIVNHFGYGSLSDKTQQMISFSPVTESPKMCAVLSETGLEKFPPVEVTLESHSESHAAH